MNREDIYSAIWALAPISQFKTYGRKLKPYDGLKAAQYPALFQTQVDEVVKSRGNLPGQYQGGVRWWVYAYTDPSGTESPSQIINPLLDAIEAALKPGPGAPGSQTLGGLVDQCYIDGTIKTDEGYLDNYSVAIVPIVFVVGGY